MTGEQMAAVEAREIETVTGDFHTEPGKPFYRVEIDGYCADFDYREAAENFAQAINRRTATLQATVERQAAEIARLQNALGPFALSWDTSEYLAEAHWSHFRAARQALGEKHDG